MFTKSIEPNKSTRSSSFVSALALAATLSLLSPSAAYAESSPIVTSTSESSKLTPEDVVAISEKQITAANSTAEKFSSSDVLEQVRKKLTSDKLERDQKLAEEAAVKAKDELAAKLEAEKKSKGSC